MERTEYKNTHSDNFIKLEKSFSANLEDVSRQALNQGDRIVTPGFVSNAHAKNFRQQDEVLVSQFDELGIQEFEYPDHSHTPEDIKSNNVSNQRSFPNPKNSDGGYWDKFQHNSWRPKAPKHRTSPPLFHQYYQLRHPPPPPPPPPAYENVNANDEFVQHVKDDYLKEMQLVQDRLKQLRTSMRGEEWQSMGEVLLSLEDMLFMYQSTADSLAIERVKRGQMNEQIQMQWRHIAKTRQEIHELRDKLRSVERSRQLPPGFVPSSTNFHLVPDTVPDIDTPMLNHPVLKQSTSETGYSDSRDSDNTSINGHNVNNNNTASNQLQQLQQQQQSAQMSVYATPFVPTVKQM
eukprot:TRINITY_DN3741_c0_g1_i3.p1 TRINITY_DN3741_c0_g1~~TRINITY_DN3741_c0_g1_i3.p1  ORF type:complete len:348 (-),score=36.12 TRINITY_DN3741_c0_g1_i3:932-1975(-)